MVHFSQSSAYLSVSGSSVVVQFSQSSEGWWNRCGCRVIGRSVCTAYGVAVSPGTAELTGWGEHFRMDTEISV